MQTNSYLKYTSLSKTVFWDFYSLSNRNSILSNYPIVKLKEVINQRKESITINDDLLYKRCRVQVQARGVVLRDEVLGKEIKTKKQQLCKTDDFLVAEIDAKVGGYGIVPANLENAIVSSHYFLFEIDRNKLTPEFLGLIIKQYHFSKQIKSTGSTNYAAIRPYHVLEYEIPLPSLEEQSKIVNAFNEKLKLAEQQEQQVKQLVEDIEKHLFDELGKKKEIFHKKNKGLNFVKYNELDKWGLDFIGNNNSDKNKYETLNIKEFCKISSGGTPSRSIKEYFKDGTIPWIKTGELTNGVIYKTEENITDEALKNSSAKLYEEGSIAIAMYGATIGKTAKLGVKASTNQACAVLFNIDNSIVLTDYLWEYLQLQTENLKKLAYGSAQPNLNAGIISNYKIPIPPIEKQKEISEHIASIKRQIKQLNSLSIKNKEEAILEFEKKVFN